MGTESEKKPTLTISDPVDAVTLKRISEISARRDYLGNLMLDLEQEKVRILVETRRLDDEKSKVFETILTTRGLPPNVAVEVDPDTGKLSLVRRPDQVPEAPVAKPTVPENGTAQPSAATQP